jgi:hypothetical protein
VGAELVPKWDSSRMGKIAGLRFVEGFVRIGGKKWFYIGNWRTIGILPL